MVRAVAGANYAPDVRTSHDELCAEPVETPEPPEAAPAPVVEPERIGRKRRQR
jgi:hypothetical protein